MIPDSCLILTALEKHWLTQKSNLILNGVFYTKKTDKDGMADLGIMLRPGSTF